MSATDATDTGAAGDVTQVGAAAEQLFGAVLGGFEAITIHLGHQLGLYQVLADGGRARLRR